MSHKDYTWLNRPSKRV